MAYDEEVSERMRQALSGVAGITEKRMMGGLCFMLRGNMLGGAHREKSGERLFMFRVGRENEAEALARPHARPMQFGSRRATGGFVFVDADRTNEVSLKSWIKLAMSYVSPMAPK
jgi:hypothetical protein